MVTNRRELARKYKETPRPAGVYRVRNTASGKSLIGSSTDLPGILNRQRFQLQQGAHPDRELQKDWNDLGPGAFTFEALDVLAPSEAPDYDPSADLRVLEQMWVERLVEAGEPLYARPVRR